jgi:hypothetical protein
VGEAGTMNCTHLVCLGHMAYFLRRWHNLYQYPNQVREYKNKQIRYIYHHRRPMGGNSGSGQHNSKRKPLCLWFFRCLCKATPTPAAPVVYAHRRTYIPAYTENHTAQRSAGACLLCNSTEHEYSQQYYCPINLVMA